MKKINSVVSLREFTPSLPEWLIDLALMNLIV